MRISLFIGPALSYIMINISYGTVFWREKKKLTSNMNVCAKEKWEWSEYE